MKDVLAVCVNSFPLVVRAVFFSGSSYVKPRGGLLATPTSTSFQHCWPAHPVRLRSNWIMGSAKKPGTRTTRKPNAARERSRVQSLRDAYQSLQSALPAIPPSTKLSKLDVLLMATAYISHLARLAEDHHQITDASHQFIIVHPVKKWPMRARMYADLNPANESTNKSLPNC